jgi:hypothetical protein
MVGSSADEVASLTAGGCSATEVSSVPGCSTTVTGTPSVATVWVEGAAAV